MALERNYQARLIGRIERLLPGCCVRKIDVQQGWPDLLILYGTTWALLEVKRSKPTSSDFEPNQEWWIDHFDRMSFSACIYPENEKDVLYALRETFESRG